MNVLRNTDVRVRVITLAIGKALSIKYVCVCVCVFSLSYPACRITVPPVVCLATQCFLSHNVIYGKIFRETKLPNIKYVLLIFSKVLA